MNRLPTWVVGLIGMFILLAIAAVALRLLLALIGVGRRPSGAPVAAEDEPLPVERFVRVTEPIVSPAERAFLRVLENALYDDLVAERVRVAVQVQLTRLIAPEPGLTRGERARHRNKIDRKTVDFVVADGEWKPMVAIELDDRSHERGDRRRRDADVERWLGQAGVRLVRVAVRREYDVAEVRGMVAAAVRGEG